MSLRVWLPMNRDLKNQGLDDVTVTNNGATFNSAGKLGGCYYFNATSQSINLTNYMTTLKTFTNYSISAWVYIETKAGDHSASILSSGNWNQATGQLVFGFSSWSTDHYTKLLVPNTSGWSNGISYNFMQNTWYHITITYNGSKTLAYVNGIKIGEYNGGGIATESNTNNLYVGCATYYGSFNLRGKLNDVRIYDHCLSSMEVKELSKGLVLHYPLNRGGWGQENLLLNGGDLTKWNIENGVEVNFDAEEQMYKIVDTTHSNDSRWGIYQNFQVLPNTTYTFSIEGKAGTSNTTAGIFTYESGTAWPSPVYTFTTTKSKCIHTFTTGSNHTVGRVYLGINTSSGNKTAWYKYPKLELGSIATPWCPNSSDALATAMGLNGTTEYDCSGYCNNGEKIGALTYTSDTPKYQVSTHIGATSQKIHISGLTTSGFGNSYSFAWWGKRTSNNPMFWGFSDGIRLNGMYIGTLWNTGDGSNNPLYKIGTTTQVTAPSVNVWHHYVMTGNGTKCYVYLDGELWAEAKTYKAISGTSIYINGWNSATDYCSDNTDISDFRIYATALSADDVKSLYQNCAYIDSSGNIYGAVHSEV